jgi:preprotein translocase subunit SecD
MKSIIYILIGVNLGGMLLSAIPTPTVQTTEVVEIQCVGQNFSEDQFIQSVEIIKKRLKDFKIQNVKVVPDSIQCRIKIEFDGHADRSEVERLVSSKGRLEFYETRNRKVAIERLSADDFLYSMLYIPMKKRLVAKLNSQAIFGFSREDNRTEVENYLKMKASDGLTFPGVKFAWSIDADENSSYELFLLKTSSGLNNEDVLEAIGKLNDSDTTDILISFTESGSKVWQEMTRNCIDKSIAIVVDGQVYAAPVVKSEIINGKCMLSGHFSVEEANVLASLINNDELPLVFELVK